MPRPGPWARARRPVRHTAPARRVLWLQAYARSLSEPDGPWAGFARQTVEDWLGLLAEVQGAAGGARDATLGLALLRGALLDLLARATPTGRRRPWNGISA